MLYASPSLEHRFELVACRFQTARRLKTKSTDEGSRHVAKEEVCTPQFFLLHVTSQHVLTCARLG